MTSYGKNIKIEIYGGSHDSEIGIKASGIPAGISFDYDELKKFMKRRAPGQSNITTQRKESDTPLLISGFDGYVTNGDEIHIAIRSENMRSGDYKSLENIPRPSHADYPAYVKTGGKADLRGGGHFSGRLTAPLCALGGIFLQYLRDKGIMIAAHILSVGGENGAREKRFDPVNVSARELDELLSRSFPVLEADSEKKVFDVINSARMKEDSVGGVIECAAVGLPVGIGEHIFCGMESRISSIIFAIPAVKGIEFGAGFESACMTGSENNDPFFTDGVKVYTKTNNAGGILGGMTSGAPLIFRCAVKPTPSIGLEQDSVNLGEMKNVKTVIRGRHDPCIVPRAIPVVEAACAVAIFDALLDNGETER